MVAVIFESLLQASQPRFDLTAFKQSGCLIEVLTVAWSAKVHVGAQQQANARNRGEVVRNVREPGRTEERSSYTNFADAPAWICPSDSSRNVQQVSKCLLEGVALTVVNKSR